MKLSVKGPLPQSLNMLNLVKSSRGRAFLLLIVSLVMLAACNRPKERQLVEVPTAVNELAALPTNIPAPTEPASDTTAAPTDEPTEVPDEVEEAPATDEAAEIEVAFVEPADGATVSGTFSVTMSASGILVEPAGEVKDGSGHMHILVDTDFVPAGEAIVNDEQHLHFGNAQLETELTLEPGEHVLRLQLADGAHVALEGDEYRDEITVIVEAPAEDASEDAVAEEETSDEAEEIEVAFVEPEDGATVSGTFSVTMSATGILVEPAGDVKEGSGHMHILVDTDFVPAGEAIVNDEQHLHFGNAQLETELTLEPGEHVLRLQLADGAHVALEGDEYRDEITVIVEEAEEDASEDTVAEDDTSGDEDEASDEEAVDEDASDEEVTDEDAIDESSGDDAVDEDATDEEATDEAEADAPVEDENAIVRSPTELWVSMACSACHNINENQTEDNIGQPGPHQNNLYERAGERVEGMDAEEYVYNSIVNTNDFIVEPYVANIMPQNFGERMSEEEIQGLVDWLLDPNRESLP